MKTFLYETIEELLKEIPDLTETKLFLPGVRPKAFIKKIFAELNYSGILPEMYTIEELLQEISGLKMISSVPLLFEAYNSYLKSVPEPKSFEDFLKFAPTLLKDFDDMDAALCDDKGLLDILISDERIRNWGASMDIGLSEVMKNQLGFWTDARAMFYPFRNDLLNKGLAYRGLMARQAAELAKGFIQNLNGHCVFIGFNALTKAENQILETFYESGKTLIFWDADTYYLNDTQQEAGDFLRVHQEHFGKKFRTVHSSFEQPKEFSVVSVPKQETQAKYVGDYLSKMSSEERERTAVVLGDELLLPAVLNALPPEVEKLNITMGLPLKSVSMSSFFREVFEMHLNREKFGKKDVYYYKNVLNILQNSNFSEFFLPQSVKLMSDIHQQNQIFIAESRLINLANENPSFFIFRLPVNSIQLLEIIHDWIETINQNYTLTTLQQEYLFRFKSVFLQLRTQLENYTFIDSYKVLHQLYQQLLQLESVSFVGEPLVGLQLLGMLETRLLDFEHIVLTSVNEGTLPLGRRENSFIPFDYRKTFGLNTFLENDAVYAYHFYRLVQRCRSAVFLYSSDSEGMGSGEPSRFLLQLLQESPHKVREVVASPAFAKPHSSLIEIPKSEAVMEKLNHWKNRISPSSLSSYLYNPLDFYKQRVLMIRQSEEIEEIAGDMTIGTIVHGVLEVLYKDYLDTVLQPVHFRQIENKRQDIFNKVVSDKLLHGGEVRGKNVLILKVADEMIGNVLKKDLAVASENQLIIRQLEVSIQRPFTTPSGIEAGFTGVIDRIDELNGITRILDYKTGSVNSTELRWKNDNVYRVTEDYKGGKAIQLAIYAYMLNRDFVQTGIYPLRYFSQDIQLLNYEGSMEIELSALAPLMEQIGFLIEDILNPEIPFLEPEPRFTVSS